VLSVPDQHQLVVVTDTLIEGVHFPVNTQPYDIAWKALAVNLSDLAAMAATPAFYSLALSLPADKNNENWLAEFTRGLTDLSKQHAIPLIGGDTTKSSLLTVTITAQGWVENGKAVLRSGAQQGDLVYVSGTIGEGGLGLKAALNDWKAEDYKTALDKLNRPTPQNNLAQALQPYMKSAIDISDGLLADSQHLMKASNVGLELDVAKLPLSDEMQQYIAKSSDWTLPWVAGDDYELCFTVSQNHQQEVERLVSELELKVTCIGQVVDARKGCVLKNAPDDSLSHQAKGFLHF